MRFFSEVIFEFVTKNGRKGIIFEQCLAIFNAPAKERHPRESEGPPVSLPQNCEPFCSAVSAGASPLHPRESGGPPCIYD